MIPITPAFPFLPPTPDRTPSILRKKRSAPVASTAAARSPPPLPPGPPPRRPDCRHLPSPRGDQGCARLVRRLLPGPRAAGRLRQARAAPPRPRAAGRAPCRTPPGRLPPQAAAPTASGCSHRRIAGAGRGRGEAANSAAAVRGGEHGRQGPRSPAGGGGPGAVPPLRKKIGVRKKKKKKKVRD